MNKNYIIENAMQYLWDNGIDRSRVGVENNVEALLRNKESIIAKLKYHPQWNEEAMQVVIPYKEERPLDKNTALRMTMDMTNIMRNDSDYLDENLSHDLRSEMKTIPLFEDAYVPDVYRMLKEIFYRLLNDNDNNTVSPELAKAIRTFNSDLRVNANMKISRALRKIFDYYRYESIIDDFESQYAEISDALAPSSTDRVFVISVNPLDYLTVSNGKGWSSCYTLSPHRNEDGQLYKGKHKAAILSTMTDNVSIICYTLSKDYGIDNWKMPKLNRSIVFWDCDNDRFVLNRIYPKSTDSKDYIWKMYADTLKDNLLNCDAYPYSFTIFTLGDNFMYPDYKHYRTEYYTTSYTSPMPITQEAYCLTCGKRKLSFESYNETDNTDTMNCYNCYRTNGNGYYIDEDYED